MRITERMLAAERLRRAQQEQHDMERNMQRAGASTIDAMAYRILEQAVGHYGIRLVTVALMDICDVCAKNCADYSNIAQAKQWAAWATALRALSDDKTGMIEPGRE